MCIRDRHSFHRTNGLLSRIKYRNRGNWCGPRVVPVFWEGISIFMRTYFFRSGHLYPFSQHWNHTWATRNTPSHNTGTTVPVGLTKFPDSYRCSCCTCWYVVFSPKIPAGISEYLQHFLYCCIPGTRYLKPYLVSLLWYLVPGTLVLLLRRTYPRWN